MNEQQIQMQATKEALHAKHEFERAEQISKVTALADQVRERIDSLLRVANEARFASLYAEEKPVRFHHGAFGRDTETLDELLRALSEESSLLDNMRSASEATAALQEKFEGLIAAQATEGEGQSDGEPVPLGGTYL